MTGVEGVLDPETQASLNRWIDELGQFAALSYAQRAVGQRETGTLSPADCEQINGQNAANFQRRLDNMCITHVRALQKAQ